MRPPAGAGTIAESEVIIFPGVRVERLIYDLSERPHAPRGSVSQTLRQPEFEDY